MSEEESGHDCVTERRRVISEKRDRKRIEDLSVPIPINARDRLEGELCLICSNRKTGASRGGYAACTGVGGQVRLFDY